MQKIELIIMTALLWIILMSANVQEEKNKIFQNWIKNINKELLTSELRKTKEGNLFIVNLLKKINQVLGDKTDD